MTKYLLFFTLSFLIASCCNCSHTEKSQDNSGDNSVPKTETVKLSSTTLAFYKNYKAERVKIPPESKFIPSAALINDFHLSKVDDEFYINGMIKVNDKVNIEELTAYGIKINTKAGNIWTVVVPVDSFNNLMGAKGIEYIQIDEQVKIR
ncbi:MAG: hypothetical protein WCT77_00545 [Bacteroidota bacterium]